MKKIKIKIKWILTYLYLLNIWYWGKNISSKKPSLKTIAGKKLEDIEATPRQLFFWCLDGEQDVLDPRQFCRNDAHWNGSIKTNMYHIETFSVQISGQFENEIKKIQKVSGKGRGSGTSVPACPCPGAHWRGYHCNSARYQGKIWSPSRCPHPGFSYGCSSYTFKPVHYRSFSAGQGHRPDRRGCVQTPYRDRFAADRDRWAGT